MRKHALKSPLRNEKSHSILTGGNLVLASGIDLAPDLQGTKSSLLGTVLATLG